LKDRFDRLLGALKVFEAAKSELESKQLGDLDDKWNLTF